jgi:hypothetical protein
LFLTIVLSIAQKTVQTTKPILFEKCIKYVGSGREILSPNPDPDVMVTDPKEGLPTSFEEELFCEMLF